MVRASKPLSIGSWAIYDFANTIFYGVVITMYLPGYVQKLAGGALTPYALATPPAMILAALLAPALGEIVDRSGKARRYVIGFTVACAMLSCLLAVPTSVVGVLVTYSCALLAYNLALVFYNTMLPAVARDGDMARVSGLGVGLGYLGNVFAFPIAAWVVGRYDGDSRPAYVLAGVLFLLFSLPLAFFCPDPAPKPRAEDRTSVTPGGGTLAAGSRQLGATWNLVRRCVRERPLLTFFLGNFLCADALNAAYQQMVPFIESEKGLGINRLAPMLAINIVAFPAAIVMGMIGDRTSPKPVMIAGAISFLFAVLIPERLIALSADGDLPAWFMGDAFGVARWQVIAGTALVLFGAIGVGGVLGAARKWICRLTPEAEHGAWFGVYALTNKLSLVGLLAFSALHDRRGDYRDSIAFLVVELAIACVLLARTPRARPDFVETTA